MNEYCKRIYKKGDFIKCKSIKVATLRGWFTYPLTIGKLYEIQRDSYDECNIINDRGIVVKFLKLHSEKLFMTKDEIREEKLNKILE